MQSDMDKMSSNIVAPLEECVDFDYRFYYRSAKRHRSLKQIGDIIEEDVAYFSAPQGTRWMASRQGDYAALRQNLTAVCLHTEDAATGKGEETAKCRGYLRKLKSLDFKQALHFMIDLLNILAEISCALPVDGHFVKDKHCYQCT